jgi:hypothetical protein
MFCEDDDLILRLKLLGLEQYTVLDSIVYHFVSKTSRFSEEYQKNTKIKEIKSNQNFIRKWGSYSRYSPLMEPIIPSKYNIGFRVLHCNYELLELLEPWCDNILIDDEMQVLTSYYWGKEQLNTKFNLNEKILSTPFQTLNNDIIVEIDRNSFTQQDFNYIQQLPQIIKESGEVGEFELGNLKITIHGLTEYQDKLIYL